MSLNILQMKENILTPFEEKIALDSTLVEEREAKYLGDCTVTGEYLLKNREVYVKANCFQKVLFLCDSCLDPVERNFEFSFEVTYKENGDEYLYSNNCVDLTEVVIEEFILNMPIQVLCSEDCKGLCCTCGANLNHETCTCAVKKPIVDENPFAILLNNKK